MSERFQSAPEAISWINGARWKGEKKGLENTRALLEKLGHPEQRMGKIVHVAGTNGKGSTCAFLESGLKACGYHVGLFTSPYLRFFNERIVFDGKPIDDEALIDVASRVREAAEALTYEGVYCTTFELLTASACLYYALRGADYAVMEVGMGGRLDSTNVLPSSVSLIAAIGMDHMQSLGVTIEQFAFEKAGIMKPGVPVVVAPNPKSVIQVMKQNARSVSAPLYLADKPLIEEQSAEGCRFTCKLSRSTVTQTITIPGAHQAQNAALALTGLELLGVDMARAVQGVERASWPGRLDKRGNVLIDCAHNPQGANTLKEYVERFFKGRKKVLLTGMMKDKQVASCSEIFGSFADEVVTTQVSWPRAIGAEELKGFYPNAAAAFDSVSEGLAAARSLAGEDGLVICAGSVYLAGDVINLLEGENA
ncbi:MAG: bifunctional folylpolyglutamate synthase/dihydrofolate synthase [Clostridia bacterium]|nr:bifunctional folylpolyglutamate synthase/dihydrofolate synthase [Clostridia bacterium]